MTTWTREDVIAKVMHDFPDADPSIVLAIIDQYGVESHERERERVQRAILDLSDGDLARAESYTINAKCDYRDVLRLSE